MLTLEWVVDGDLISRRGCKDVAGMVERPVEDAGKEGSGESRKTSRQFSKFDGCVDVPRQLPWKPVVSWTLG